jgi:hypothetical protein
MHPATLCTTPMQRTLHKLSMVYERIATCHVVMQVRTNLPERCTRVDGHMQRVQRVATG